MEKLLFNMNERILATFRLSFLFFASFQICVLNGDHNEPVRCVQFNPKYMMMASACKNMAFWLPSVDEDS